jgi:hypothetical protein
MLAKHAPEELEMFLAGKTGASRKSTSGVITSAEDRTRVADVEGQGGDKPLEVRS